ncbi:phage/plasmid primase, P4 family [Actinobacillus equuli subsp. equuli]|uniref:DNA primase family protein n=1 Tax=Actinobacillus equuli TaxID=718 RepID=UPI0024424F68|nr:phage/plasmid primase, P4 family [Actinobacillus equuli]WGE65917.1 phage/plasmid primase, P4 family [Actinobacillus equuli subsp. equuli]
MQRNIKLAPNMKKQKSNSLNAFILVGSQAWDFAQMPKEERTQTEIMLETVLQVGENSPPIILDETILGDVGLYRIAPETARYITIQRANKCEAINAKTMAALCLNIAKNTQAQSVHYIDEAGQFLEDLSGYVDRIRKGETVAEMVADATKSEEQRKAEFAKLFDTMGDNEKISVFMEWYKKPICYHEQLETLYHYTGQKWEAVEDVAMGRCIRNFFLEYGIVKYNASKIEKMLSLFKYDVERMGKRDPNLLAFANGILHKQTGEFMLHAKEYFLTSFINIDYNSMATPTPNFNKWINWVSDGDDQKKMRVLAALYMILTNRYEWQLFLEITGEGGTGKSVFNHLAKILAGGDDNTAALSLKDLESPTMRCGLIDKTLCYSPDQESYIGDGGVLRSITGGDSVSFRPLYRSAFKDIVKAIFLITGNSPIIFKEQKGGTSRRRVIFQFNKVVNESDKDYHLKDKLEQEAGGIVRLLLDTFPEPMAAKQLLEEQKASEEAIKVKEESDHILQFAKYFEAREIINGLTLGSSRKEGAHRTALHSSYLYFCDRMGIINPLQRNRFRQAFEHALKERGSPQPLRTRIKDGINVTNIYYIDMMNTLRDWDN